MRVRERWAKLYETSDNFAAVWALSVLVLAAIVYPMAVAAWYNNIGNSNADWVHHLYLRKEAALATAGEGPRLLVVGGSGCLFSLDTEALQQELGQPVINLCSHAGTGLEYQLARARRHARPGDTVLLATEYRSLINPDPRQTRIEWDYFTTWDRRHYWEHGLPDAYRMLYGISFSDLWGSREGWRQWRAGYKEKLENIYDVTLMTPSGDLRESIGHRDVLAGSLDNTFLPPAELARQLAGDFERWAHGRGVHVLAAYQAAALDPPDYYRTKALFASLPQWWKSLGIPAVGTPEQSLYPSAGFMDTLQHAGPGVAYANAVQIGRALRHALPAADWLLVPPHPPQNLLPLPHLPGKFVKVYFGSPAEDEDIRTHLASGGRVLAATSPLGEQLRLRGFRWGKVESQFATPRSALGANRDAIVAICVKPDAGAIQGLEPIAGGQAWTGLWKDGRWDLRQGPETAEFLAAFQLPLVTSQEIAYSFTLRASPTACQMTFQNRDRSPSPASRVRMLILDPRRGILRGIHNFDADLRAELRWAGEILAP